MPFYVAKPGSPLVERAYLTTPLVALETDAPLESVPAAVRRAADLGDGFDLGRWSRAETQPGAHATIVWFPGERLVTGESDYIRRDLHVADQRMFAPVHLACSKEVDLVGLQPRWYSGRPASDGINQAVRIAGNADPAPQLRDFFEQAAEPWALLYRALLRGSANPRAGLALLDGFRSSPGVHSTLDALALRNQVALLLTLRDYAEARRAIKRGIAAYPDYAELFYLGALVSLAEQDLGRAIAQLQEATRKSNPRLVGAGGENSYRAHWLVATLSEGAGNESVAFHHFRGGLYARSAFEPSVISLLKHRFPEDALKQLAYDLAALARREPKYLEPVFYYLLLHGKVGIVRRILETHAMNPSVRERLAERFAAFSPARHSARASGPPGVCLIGPLFVHSSLARINRELAAALLESRKVSACLEPHGFGERRHAEFARAESLQFGLMRRPPEMRLTIRHHWPPNFRRPVQGRLAVILPWEYGAAPRRWIEGIRRSVDEVWVPSAFVRQVLVEGGAPATRVRVIPNGIDTSVFRPDGPRWRPAGAKGFVFLFVGGAIPRKGVDLLAKAYGRAFSSRDDVTLIVKEIGSDTFYRHMSLVKELRRGAGRRNGPHLEVLSGEIDDEALAGLYRGADAFVLPYRAEGFGMPAAEAMACGKPVVVTDAGPAPEFVPAELGYWVPARRVPVPEPPPPLGAFAGDFTWFEPDVDALAARLREAFENRTEAARRGAAGAEHVRGTLAWQRITRLYLDRVEDLVSSGSAETAESTASAAQSFAPETSVPETLPLATPILETEVR
jgi:glycosyltransferase involved in cell wall biosynthesis